MTNLFERIKQSIAADFHDVIDQKEERRNPVSVLNQYVRESEAEVKKAKILLERQGLLKEEFHREWKQAEQMVKKRKEQGRIALQAGAEDLAEIALREQALYEEREIQLQKAFDNAEQQLQELEQKYREMKLKVKDMHIKQLELMGRENVITMKNKMNKILDGSEFGKAAEKFEDLEMDMERKELTADNEYEISIFDARIQQLAKEIKKQESSSTTSL